MGVPRGRVRKKEEGNHLRQVHGREGERRDPQKPRKKGKEKRKAHAVT